MRYYPGAKIMEAFLAGLAGLLVGIGAFNGVLGGFLYVATETDIYENLEGLSWAVTQFVAIAGALVVAILVAQQVFQYGRRVFPQSKEEKKS